MFGKMTIAIATIGILWVGGIFPSMTYGENSGPLIVHEDGKNKSTGSPGASEQIKEKKDMENTFCPVSGEKIDEKMKVTYEYKGRIYRFCCQDCIDEFKKDPEEYIEKMEKRKAETNRLYPSAHVDHH